MSFPARPAPIPVLHPFRDVTTARTSVQELPHRRLRLTIDHAPLEGVTPEMLLWWFGHIGGDMPALPERRCVERVLVTTRCR